MKLINKVVSLLLFVSLFFAACDDDDGSGPDIGEGGTLYATFIRVDNPDGRINYVALTEDLEKDTEIDLTRALEVPGFSRMYAVDGRNFFAIGDGEDMTITRYTINESDEFVQGGRISFAGEGVTQMHWRNKFLSATKAYYVDVTQGQIVVWNPETMAITKTIALPEQVADGYQGYNTSVGFFDFPVLDDQMYIPLEWLNFNTNEGKAASGLVVVNTQTDQVISYTETDKAPAATNFVVDTNGDIYFGTSSYYVSHGFVKDGTNRPNGGILRVKAGETVFDESYYVPFSGLTDGERIGVALASAPGEGIAYTALLNEDITSWSNITDFRSYVSSSGWEKWKINLRTGEVELEQGLPAAGPGADTRLIDGEPYIFSFNDFGSTTAFKLNENGNHEEKLTVDGLLQLVVKVR